MLCLLLSAGCVTPPTSPTEKSTQQVPAVPFTEPRGPIAQKVTYTAASQDTSYRVELIRGKLIGENPQSGLRPYVTAIGSADPEIFHVSLNQIYITQGLVQQCQTEGQLAAVLANELGRMVSEREAGVSDQVRNPERPPPIMVPIGVHGNGRDADPTFYAEMAKQEKVYPKQTKKLPPPNPQQVARNILERAGYERTELDGALPILQNAERFQVLQNQFKGTPKQGDWKMP
jgi:predicted Zn-dependent protease